MIEVNQCYSEGVYGISMSADQGDIKYLKEFVGRITKSPGIELQDVIDAPTMYSIKINMEVW